MKIKNIQKLLKENGFNQEAHQTGPLLGLWDVWENKTHRVKFLSASKRNNEVTNYLDAEDIHVSSHEAIEKAKNGDDCAFYNDRKIFGKLKDLKAFVEKK